MNKQRPGAGRGRPAKLNNTVRMCVTVEQAQKTAVEEEAARRKQSASAVVRLLIDLSLGRSKEAK